jgi:tetratricopeptide (TPR) repeat protein
MTHNDLCERAQRLIERGDFASAVTTVEQGLQQQPDNGQMWLLKGVGLGLAGRHEEALACFERCIALYPRILSGWYHRSVALSALGQSRC